MRMKTKDMRQDSGLQQRSLSSQMLSPCPTIGADQSTIMNTDLPPSSLETDLSLTFDDNRLASLVFGLYDQNLAHIERKLGLQITANGNHVVIKGLLSAAEQARHVLESLYEQVRKGIPITTGEVDGAIEESALQGSLFPPKTEKITPAPSGQILQKVSEG